VSEEIPACVEQEGGVLVSADVFRTLAIPSEYQKYPHFFEPTTLNLARVGQVMVDGLYAQHYFASGEKLGIVSFDDPRFHSAYTSSIVPALKKHGLKVTDARWVRMPQTYGDYGQFSDDLANAAFAFKSEGIDHVMFQDVGANVAFFFMQAAQRQQYSPRYGLTSRSGNAALADLLGSDANSQLHGSKSIGWVPIEDTHAQDDPDAKNPTRVRCLGLMTKAGVKMDSRTSEKDALTLCDSFWFTLTAISDAGNTLTQASFVQGLDKAGSTYQPGSTFGTEVSASHPDGASAVANMSYFDSCSCYRFTSKPYRVP
jgi:hypothetical protein